MKIAVCDNDKDFLYNMKKLLEKLVGEYESLIVYYSSGAKLLKDFEEQGNRYDVIFMDIELEGMDGITLGKHLMEVDEDMLLIFLTNYVEYAVRGYEARAFRYLLKPVNELMLKNILSEIKREREKGKRQVLHIPKEGEDILVPLGKILYLESREKYTIIWTTEEHYLTRNSLNDYEQQLHNSGFCRIHRKYLVNMRHVNRWKFHQVEVGGQLLPISRRKEKEFRELFYDFLEKGI